MKVNEKDKVVINRSGKELVGEVIQVQGPHVTVKLENGRVVMVPGNQVIRRAS